MNPFVAVALLRRLHERILRAVSPYALRNMIGALCCFVSTSPLSAPTVLPDLPTVAVQVIDLTNAFRTRNGLLPVSIEPRLSHAAQDFADVLAAKDRIGHDIDGRAPTERAGAAGYRHCMVAENIAYLFDSVGFTTEQLAARLMQGWEQSAEHRRNMLLAPVMHIGVGIAQNADNGRYYAVQLFGRPSSAAIRFEVVNSADVDLRYEVDRETFDLAPHVTRTHTRCIDASLAILAPESGDRPGIRVRDGARYVIVRDPAGQLQLQMQ